MLHDPAGWDAAFAVTQLLLGAGLLWRRSVRAALAASIGWAPAVWLGEGLGGVLSGTASPLSGAPGARSSSTPAGRGGLAPPRDRPLRGRIQPAGPARGPLAWLLLWSSFAYFLLQPANRTPRAT